MFDGFDDDDRIIDHETDGENETEELINFTKLSPVGLKEMGDEVLRLDENASTASEDVFGPSEPAKRTL